MEGVNHHGRFRRSDVIDWAIVVAAIAIALPLTQVNPDSHTFDVLSLSISHPYRQHPKIPEWLLFILAVFTPAAVVALVSIQTTRESTRQTRIERLHNGLLGLGVSLGIAAIVLNIKNLAGKPRPDFLARCQPDLSRISEFTVGGYGASISPLWVMVHRDICTTDQGALNEGFRSFPCGYATVAFAGLCYLSFWITDLFEVSGIKHMSTANEDAEHPLLEGPPASVSLVPQPVYYLFLPLLPFGMAIFISGTRYFDYRNHGIDVVAGAAFGLLAAYIGFVSRHPRPQNTKSRTIHL